MPSLGSTGGRQTSTTDWSNSVRTRKFRSQMRGVISMTTTTFTVPMAFTLMRLAHHGLVGCWTMRYFCTQRTPSAGETPKCHKQPNWRDRPSYTKASNRKHTQTPDYCASKRCSQEGHFCPIHQRTEPNTYIKGMNYLPTLTWKNRTWLQSLKRESPLTTSWPNS